MKLKTYKACKECMSCTEMFHNGEYYCNMKANIPEYKEQDISTCRVDPETKPEDCPWDKTAGFVGSLNWEDQMGLKCIAKMFGGDTAQSWFEDETIEWENAGCDWIRCPVCNSMFDVELFFTGKTTMSKYDIRFCPGCGVKISSDKYFGVRDNTK